MLSPETPESVSTSRPHARQYGAHFDILVEQGIAFVERDNLGFLFGLDP